MSAEMEENSSTGNAAAIPYVPLESIRKTFYSRIRQVFKPTLSMPYLLAMVFLTMQTLNSTFA